MLLALGLTVLPGCNRESLDGDGDGFTELTNDCDDSNANVHPDAVEVCYNGIDDNCNGEEDEEGATSGRTWYVDTDGDGYGQNAVTPMPASSQMATQPKSGTAGTTTRRSSQPQKSPGLRRQRP